MINLPTLKRQHKEIGEMLGDLKQSIGRDNVAQEASDIARKISLLAGKLKVHLNTEDQYMYPQLLQSEHLELKNIARTYIDEMGYISKAFMEYKDRFNTKMKISGNLPGFMKETREIIEILEERIAKEDASLYTVLE